MGKRYKVDLTTFAMLLDQAISRGDFYEFMRAIAEGYATAMRKLLEMSEKGDQDAPIAASLNLRFMWEPGQKIEFLQVLGEMPVGSEKESKEKHMQRIVDMAKAAGLDISNHSGSVHIVGDKDANIEDALEEAKLGSMFGKGVPEA